jgi:hypothetical protein
LRDPADPRAARRRLLKGSFSSPALLVLPSGGAWAASSSRCIANDAAQKYFPGILDTTSTTANYVRVPIYTYQKTSGKTISNWVKGSDLNGIATAAGVSCSWISSSQYLCMVGGNPPTGSVDYVAGTIYPIVNGLRAPYETELKALTGKAYAVSVDASGNIIGVDKVLKDGTGGAVHMSCWSSFF